MSKKVPAEIIREIQAVGYMADVNTLGGRKFPKITVESNITSVVFALGSGTGIMLELRISTDRPLNLVEFGQFDLAGRPFDVDWWIEEEAKLYSLYYGHNYPQTIVLNHRIGKQGRIRPGLPMIGYLLGRSRQSVPLNLRSSEFPASLAIEDEFQTSRHEFPVRFDRELGALPKNKHSLHLHRQFAEGAGAEWIMGEPEAEDSVGQASSDEEQE